MHLGHDDLDEHHQKRHKRGELNEKGFRFRKPVATVLHGPAFLSNLLAERRHNRGPDSRVSRISARRTPLQSPKNKQETRLMHQEWHFHGIVVNSGEDVVIVDGMWNDGRWLERMGDNGREKVDE